MARKPASQSPSSAMGMNKGELIWAGALAATTIEAGNGDDTVIGSAYDDIIRGGNGKDVLYGGRGADTLEGGNGCDRLFGGAGDDRLAGGNGADFLMGGSGSDVYVYAAASESAANGMDCIAGFERGADKIDVGGLQGAAKLAWSGLAPTANGVWYAHVGCNTIVYADIDGNPATAELGIRLTGIHDLTAADFIGVAGGNEAPTAAAIAGGGAEDMAISITLGGFDGDGAVAGVVLLTLPTNGILHADAALTVPAAPGVTYAGSAARFVFMPAANFNGSVSFQYTVVDDDGAADPTPATATIVIDAVNDAPSFALMGNVVVAEDSGPQAVAGFASAISAGPGDEAGQTLTFSLTTDNDALFSVLPSIDPVTGALSYQLAPDANGSAQIAVRLSDSGGGNDTAVSSFSIVATARNDGPIAIVPAAVAGDEDASFTIAGVAVADVDMNEAPGEMRVTLSVSHGRLTLGSATGLAFLSGDGTDDAAMTFTGALANVNAALATLQYRGDADFNGADALTITCDDQGFTGGGALADTATVQIIVNPVNDAPTASLDSATVNEDTTLAGSSVLANDADLDGNGLSAVLVDGPANGTLTLNADGTYTYTPAANFTGTDGFTYRAADGAGGQSEPTAVTIAVTPVADPPAAGDDRWFISQNTAAELPLAAFLANDADPDGDALTVTGLSLDGIAFATDASDGVADGVINLGTSFGALAVDVGAGNIAYALGAATGSLSIYYQASDGSAVDTGRVTVQAVAVNGSANAIDLSAAPYNADAGSFSYIDGRSGGDTLTGSAGADYLLGGADNDLIKAGDFGDDTVNGGSNGLVNDLGSTRRLDVMAFNGTLDLTALDQGRIVDIETLSMVDSLGGGGSDGLILNAQDVIDLGRGTFDAFGVAGLEKADTIRVDGDAGDTLTLAGGNWSLVAAANVPGGYRLYVHDPSGTAAAEDAYVLVQSAVSVTIA